MLKIVIFQNRQITPCTYLQFHFKYQISHHRLMLNHEQQDKILTEILKRPENLHCADCNGKSPCWASLDFGVFICMNCSGAHRALGPSITRVKSTTLDTWNRQWVWRMQIGNTQVNEHYENALTSMHKQIAKQHRKPNMNSSLNEIKKFVYDKYVRKLYARTDQDDPMTDLKNGKLNKTAQEETPKIKTEVKVKAEDKIKAEGKVRVEAKTEMNVKTVSNAPVVVKSIKKVEVDLLGDQFSDQVNKSESAGNVKVKEQVNLFEEEQSAEPKHHVYNKDHFNSYSGHGARHSSAGHVGFEQLFNDHAHQSDKKPNFDEFSKICQSKTPQFSDCFTNNGNIGVFNSSGYHHSHQPPQFYGNVPHVTMNINMNMYPKVMNINVNGTNQAPQYTHPIYPQVKLSNPITLNMESGQQKKAPVLQSKDNSKSWVDDWK